MPPRNIRGQAEGVEETAKRLKALERTREAGTAQDYGSVVPGLLLGISKKIEKFAPRANLSPVLREILPKILQELY